MTATATPRAVHTLVVELDPDGIEPGHVWHAGAECDLCDSRPFSITFECPGIGPGGCEAWEECSTCQDAMRGLTGDALDAYHDDVSDGLVHGAQHRSFGSLPCVESGKCYVQEASAWSGEDDAWAIAEKHGPGRYPIDWDGGDYSEMTLVLVEDVTP